MSAAPSEDPEMVINETDAPGDIRGEVEIDPSLRGGTTGASAAAHGDAATEKGPAPYAHVGAAFTDWFNDKVRQLVNPTIDLGTKKASVVSLHPDGRLECTILGEGQTFVAFERQYLDQLVRKIGAIGL